MSEHKNADAAARVHRIHLPDGTIGISGELSEHQRDQLLRAEALRDPDVKALHAGCSLRCPVRGVSA
jgi:hypothetical protein